MQNLDIKDIPEAVKEIMDRKGELINKASDIFKTLYVNSVRPTVISSIINGEIIKTDSENIFIDNEYPENFSKKFDAEFEKQQKFCSKQLYDYQKYALKKLIWLEQEGHNANKTTKDNVVSNGWLLSLPIGSGKSVVFEFLATFYRYIPNHPIILSTDGQNIDKIDPPEINYYPFYYENCAYIEKAVNNVVVMKNYIQRPTTIILTHAHLLEQMKDYFESDFPTIYNPKKPRVKIAYAINIRDVNVEANYDIIIVEATAANVAYLSALSYRKPFLRVIIDDYTSMSGIETFREILASSTIFVSGSKFQRKLEDIPTSFYTLKNVPSKQLTVVGDPNDTFKGVLRNNIATFELMGNTCQCNVYGVTQNCEKICKDKFRSDPRSCYPALATENGSILQNYLSLLYTLNYIDRIKSAVNKIDADIERGKFTTDCISFYLQWKETMQNLANNPPPKERIMAPDGKSHYMRYVAQSMNPLYNYIYAPSTRVRHDSAMSDGTPICKHHCYVCGKECKDHNDYGMVSRCCGAFICNDCSKSGTTQYIEDTTTGEHIHDDKNYYCICCRSKNPTYMYNANRKSDSINVYSVHIAKNYYDTSELDGHKEFDYTFYMFLHGFKPLYHEGKPINIHNDISMEIIPKTVFKQGIIPDLDKIFPVDHLAIISIQAINTTLMKLNIRPAERPPTHLVIFGCTDNNMAQRVIAYQKQIVDSNPECPLAKINLVFIDDVSSLIGLHKNIIGIIEWTKPKNADEVAQLIGRCLRLNNFNNPLYFYITTSTTAFA